MKKTRCEHRRARTSRGAIGLVPQVTISVSIHRLARQFDDLPVLIVEMIDRIEDHLFRRLQSEFNAKAKERIVRREIEGQVGILQWDAFDEFRYFTWNQLLGHRQRRNDGPRLEQIRMVADFSQLHENVDHRHVVSLLDDVARRSALNEIVVQLPLPFRELTENDVFVLLGHLLLHVDLQSTQDEWT